MLNEEYVRELVAKGETTTVQFKRNVNNELSIVQEMVAFANTKGGTILTGVDDKTWEIIGLTDDDLRSLASFLSHWLLLPTLAKTSLTNTSFRNLSWSMKTRVDL